MKLAPTKPEGLWLRVRVEPEPDRYTLGKDAKSRAELTDALAKAIQSNPGTKVLVTAQETLPYSRVRQALEAVEAAGITIIRLAPAALEP